MKYYNCIHMNTRLGRWVGHLVPAEHDVRGGGVGVRGELVQPVPGAQQGLVARQVEHQQEPHRVPEEEGPRVPSTCQVSRDHSPEEGGGEAAEPLLARRVPQLQLDTLTPTLQQDTLHCHCSISQVASPISQSFHFWDLSK